MSEPRFSIITPVSGITPTLLRATLASVSRQTYGCWELCLLGRKIDDPAVLKILNRAQQLDPRIRFRHRETQAGIAAASNDALAMVGGEFVVLLDPGDELHPEALALIDIALQTTPNADFAYSDEDRVDAEGRRSDPFFKPGWSPERLRTQMYVGRMSALRRSAANAVGGFDPEFEGAHEWDLIFRVTERSDAVVHVPKVLYHRRAPSAPFDDDGMRPASRDAGAGTRAVQAHCARIGLKARVECDAAHPGIYHLEPALERRPTVSIVIPTAGQIRSVRNESIVLAAHCVRSVLSTSTYEAYEIVCVADTSTDAAVLDELRSVGGERLRVIDYDRRFNFSTKINLGARASDGEHLLLLNDDMEVITPDWIERMVMYSDHEGIGAVGARLLREEGRLQHAGVAFEDGLPGHPYRGAPQSFTGYAGNVISAQNYLAVTGACLMTPRATFDEVGGFEEALPINYNDVDFCLKLRREGSRVVYDPDTVLYHFESSSRSSRVAKWETDWLLGRWLEFTEADPFSNPSLRYGKPRSSSPRAWASAKLQRWLR